MAIYEENGSGGEDDTSSASDAERNGVLDDSGWGYEKSTNGTRECARNISGTYTIPLFLSTNT
jgi:hypothetical protein